MRVLVTGGTGVIGTAAVTALRAAGHEVRLLSRHAHDDARQWDGVDAARGDVADAKTLHGAADGCNAVLHIAGVAVDDGDALRSINVEGTRNVVAEAARARVARFVFVSSLGADGGTSAYHQSKRDAEAIVRASSLRWTIVRPGNVYGPGDEVIATILKMMRALPALPTIDDGEQPFQPIWHEDLAKALVAIITRDDLAEQTLEVGGAEVTSMADIITRLAAITGREPVTVPVPMAAVAAAVSTGAALPIDTTKLTMLRENNVITGSNALLDVLHIQPTPLDTGLRALAESLPEQLPDEGVGKLQHKRFFADISGTRHTAASLMTLFRDQGPSIMPVEFEAEPGTPQRIDTGVTLTGKLPFRGHFQVRAEAVDATRVVLATIEGHPLAGIVEFTSEERPGALRFAIDIYARAGNVLDFVAMNTLGAPLQAANWRRTVQGVVDASGGTAPHGVQTESESLDEDAASAVNDRVRKLIQQRQRDEHSASAENAAQR